MCGHGHAPAALPSRKDPVPIAQEAEWAPGSVWTGAENLAPTGILFPNGPARSESLYRLSYRGPNVDSVEISPFVPLSVNFTVPIIMKLSVIALFPYRNVSSRTKGVEKAGRISWTPLIKHSSH